MKKLFFIFFFISHFINYSFSNNTQNTSHDIPLRTLFDSISYWLDYKDLYIDSIDYYSVGSDIFWLKKGIYFNTKGNNQKAINILEGIIQNDTISDKIKALSYWGLGKIYTDSLKYDTYQKYYLKADSIFNKILNTTELVLYYRYLINDYNKVTVHSIPLRVIDNGINVLEANKDWANTAIYLHKKTKYYRNTGNYYQALKNHNTTIAFCKEHYLERLQGEILIFSYELYEYLEDTSRIIRDINHAIYINKKYNDSINLAQSYSEMGRYYSLIKNYKKALLYYKKAVDLNILTKDTFRLAVNSLNIGETSLFLKDYEKSEKYYNKAIDLNNIVGFDIGNGFAYASLIDIFNHTENYFKAGQYIDLAKEYARRSDYHRVDTYLYRVLADFYNKTEEKDSCIKYLFKLGQLKDSISSEEILSKMQMYETNLKEKEIALLNTEKTLLKAEQQKSRNQLMGLILIIIIVIAALMTIMALYFSKEKAYSNLVEKNMQLIRLSEKKADLSKTGRVDKEISDEDDRLAQEFMRMLKQDTQYRNQELSMDYFTDLLNTNRAYLSKAINNVFGKNFSLLVNELRIQDACKMLVDANFNYLSIEGIALTIGFSSKTSFNRAFKMQTGLTPTDFRKNQEMKSTEA